MIPKTQNNLVMVNNNRSLSEVDDSEIKQKEILKPIETSMKIAEGFTKLERKLTIFHWPFLTHLILDRVNWHEAAKKNSPICTPKAR